MSDTKETLSILATMATKFGMRPEAFEATVRAMCSPPPRRNEEAVPLTREEFAAFLLVASQYDLNPLTREIWAYQKRGGGIVPIVSIDGWINLVNRHPQCDGFNIVENKDEKGFFESCTTTIWRKDRSHPFAKTEYLSECKRDTEPWKQMPKRMCGHKSFIQAARYCFGFAGIYDEEEGRKIAEAESAASAPRVIDEDGLPPAIEAMASVPALEHKPAMPMRIVTGGKEQLEAAVAEIKARDAAIAEAKAAESFVWEDEGDGMPPALAA